MVRGNRRVWIGTFPSRYRAEVVAAALEWSADWKPEIVEGVESAR